MLIFCNEILLFRTHHLRNFITEKTLIGYERYAPSTYPICCNYDIEICKNALGQSHEITPPGFYNTQSVQSLYEVAFYFIF
jgi:hypothetical protein